MQMAKKSRSFSRAALSTVLAMVLLTVCTLPSASARHRREAADSPPGEFDYYMLSLSWSPAFCLRSPGAPECNGSRRYGFILHGLWPQNERGWPENCDGDRRVPDSVVDEIADLMPARGLVFHEWTTHGTCSGLPVDEFFKLARRARAAVRIPDSLSSPAAAIEVAPQNLLNAFMQANPRLPADSIAIMCSGQSAPRLTEIHVCFDRNLAARTCSTDALRRSCRAPLLLVPPIR